MLGRLQRVGIHGGVGVELDHARIRRGGLDAVEIEGVVDPLELFAVHPGRLDLLAALRDTLRQQMGVDGLQTCG